MSNQGKSALGYTGIDADRLVGIPVGNITNADTGKIVTVVADSAGAPTISPVSTTSSSFPYLRASVASTANAIPVFSGTNAIDVVPRAVTIDSSSNLTTTAYLKSSSVRTDSIVPQSASGADAVIIHGAHTFSTTSYQTNGTITGGTVGSTGALSGASANITNTCAAGSLSATGAISAASASITNACAAGSLSATGAISGDSLGVTNGITAASIIFGAGSTLSTYTYSSSTTTWALGAISSASTTVVFQKTGNTVYLTWPDVTITADGTSGTYIQWAGTLGVSLRPAATRNFCVRTKQDAVWVTGLCEVLSTGVIRISKDLSGSGTWTINKTHILYATGICYTL